LDRPPWQHFHSATTIIAYIGRRQLVLLLLLLLLLLWWYLLVGLGLVLVVHLLQVLMLVLRTRLLLGDLRMTKVCVSLIGLHVWLVHLHLVMVRMLLRRLISIGPSILSSHATRTHAIRSELTDGRPNSSCGAD
jgi:hypothetical protein